MELKIFRSMVSYVQIQYLVLGYQCNLSLHFFNVIVCANRQQGAQKHIIRKKVTIVTQVYIKVVPY